MKQRHATLAKLTPPRLPSVVERTRLYRLLDRARKRPIVWITAPPGFGKTTLVASYLRARKLRPLWYQVDEGDADLATFFHYLGLAVHQAAPRFRNPLPHLTPEYRQGLPTFTRRFFEELYGRLKPPAVLVFDNYQEVSPDATLHEMVAVGVGDVPAAISVIVVSRVPPPPAFARLQATQKLHVFDEDALRLTEPESRAIVRLYTRSEKQSISRAFVASLHDNFQGWVAGIVLMLEQGKRNQRIDVLDPRQTPQVVFEYLAREVLKALNPEVQDFLLKTAFLPEMTAAMAARLTGLASAGKILTDLYQSRYFTERRLATEEVYQYHPLFREFLRARAKTFLAQDDIASIRSTAALLLEEVGRIEDAIALYQAAREFREIVRLILAHAPKLLGQGRAQTLEGWLKLLPAELYEQEPWLHYWLGSCRLSFHPLESESIFERAVEKFKVQKNHAGMLMAWSGIITSIQMSWIDVSRLDRWIEMLPELHPTATPFPSQEIEANVTFCMVAALMWRRPESAVFGPWINRARILLESGPGFGTDIGMAAILANLFTWLGELRLSAKYHDLLSAQAQSKTMSPIGRLASFAGSTLLAWHMGDTQRCLRLADQGLELSRRTGVYVWDAAILGSAVYGSLLQNDFARAEKYLQETAPLVKDSAHILRANYLHLRAWLARLEGDITKSWDLIQESLEVKALKGSLFAEAIVSYAAAELLHELKDDRRASQYLNRSKVVAEEMGSHVLKFIGYLLESHIAFDQMREEAGLAALRQGLAIGKEKGLSFFAWWLPKTMTRLCARALDANIEVAYVQELIRKTRLVPDGQAFVSEAWPWPAKITTLGRFALSVDGQQMSFARKVQRRPLALLKAIIAYGGREIPETQLTDALWPESEGDAAHEAFATTLHRLRKLLRHDQIIELRDGKVTLNGQTCWVDTRAFEALFEQAEAAGRVRHSKQGLRACEKAMSLYQGPFLPEVLQEPWAQALRERLRRKFVPLVCMLSDHRQGAGELEQAVAYLERGLAVDPLAEPLYQKLIACLHQLGRLENARACYDRCRESLWTTLGAEPSPETKALYAKVRPL